MPNPDKLAQILSYSYLDQAEKTFKFVLSPDVMSLSITCLAIGSHGLSEPLTKDKKGYLLSREIVQLYILCSLDEDQSLAEGEPGRHVFKITTYLSYIRALEEAVYRIQEHFALTTSEVMVEGNRDPDTVSSNLLGISNSIPQEVSLIPSDCEEFSVHQNRFKSDIDLTVEKLVEVALEKVFRQGTDD